MPLTRREWLVTPVALSAWGADASKDRERIARVIREYEKQGLHRTATETDRISGEWLMGQVRQAGLTPSRENFSLDRIDPAETFLSAGGRRIEGVPLFDGGFTGPDGVSGRLGALGSDAPIAVTESIPNRTAGPLAEARRASRHRAIVAVTRGGRPGLCPSNAENFLHPFGPPVLQVSSDADDLLNEWVRQRLEATLVAHAKRTPAEAFNVTAIIPGADTALAPLIVMTPRSGWWTCASERGGGLVCWLELMRAMRSMRLRRDVWFVASSGHELGYMGIQAYVDRRPGIAAKARAWIHFGANIGAAQGPGNTVQASDDQMEAAMTEWMAAAGLSIDRRVPRGTVPGGEAGVVHRGNGRYMSVIGSNALFHNPADRGPEAVDVGAIARFATAFTNSARALANA